MSGVARIVYQEKTLSTGERLRAARYYEQAESAANFNDGGHSAKLSDPNRLIAVAVDPPAVRMFSPKELLTREELEVIDILGNSLLLDDLLPKAPVSAGDTWRPDDKIAAALLGVDEATRCDVQCTLKETTADVARVEFAGNLAGKADDTKTRIELKGKYRFDRKTNRIDWFALVMREKRTAGAAAVAFDVTVRLQMTVVPQASAPELAEDRLAGLNLEPTPENCRLRYESPRDRWQIVHDRCWHLAADEPGGAVLRLILDGAQVGQCNIVSLPRKEPDQLVSLEEFQEDVRRALGDSFGEFVEAKQFADDAGRRVLRVVAHGSVRGKSAELPIRWTYCHVADKQGRQAALTFTVEQELLERFADADRPILDSLRFAEPDRPSPLAKTATRSHNN